jgi:hypothetical protein
MLHVDLARQRLGANVSQARSPAWATRRYWSDIQGRRDQGLPRQAAFQRAAEFEVIAVPRLAALLESRRGMRIR